GSRAAKRTAAAGRQREPADDRRLEEATLTLETRREPEMNSNDEERSVLVSVLAGIGIGVLVGAVAGLLLAPKSGQETRDDLSKSMNDLSDRVTELGRTVSQKVTSAVDRTRATMAQKLGDVTGEGEESVG